MKIIVGNFYQESTTFNPFVMDQDAFVFFEGEEARSRIEPARIFEEKGIEVIPTIHATAISGGCVTEEAYRFFADKIIDVVKRERDIDGLWFHLHGAMEVVNVGSGEAALLREIREIVGDEIPISLTLDLHANLDDDVPKLANIIRGYRTAPHTDQIETELITANMLIDSIEANIINKPVFKRIPMITPGEKATGDTEPMKTILATMEKYEAKEGILLANYFNGHAWTDRPNTSAGVVIIPESDKYQSLAEEVADELAEYIYGLRGEFKLHQLSLDSEESIDRAISEKKDLIFVSDSGDNTTAGAAGINTYLLQLLMKKDLGNKKALVAAILDESSYKELASHEVGDNVTIDVGTDYDKYSAPVRLEGVLKAKGDLLGYYAAQNEAVGKVCTVSIGNIDVVIASHGDSFTTINHFTRAGLILDDYNIVIIKQGYLFDQLSKIPGVFHILALTPGATNLMVEDMDFHQLIRPMYPLDQ